MTVSVESRLEELTPGLKFDLERRLGRLYRKASSSVRKVSVTFGNIKGPKGKVLKQCRLILRLVNAPSVMVVTRRGDIENAFFDTYERASHTLSKRKKTKINLLRSQKGKLQSGDISIPI